MDNNSIERINNLYSELLVEIGENIYREGLKKTPLRAAKAILDLTSGYQVDIDKIVNNAIFSDGHADELILVKDIQFHSLCEHHILPFSGVAHVAYIPNDNKIIGLSKIPRIIDAFSKRLQVQERLTRQIAQALETLLQPKGVGVICEGTHSCMSMRGVCKQGSTTATSSMLGVFREDSAARAELLAMIKN